MNLDALDVREAAVSGALRVSLRNQRELTRRRHFSSVVKVERQRGVKELELWLEALLNGASAVPSVLARKTRKPWHDHRPTRLCGGLSQCRAAGGVRDNPACEAALCPLAGEDAGCAHSID